MWSTVKLRKGNTTPQPLHNPSGAALYVSGVPWTQKTDGHLTLYNHKDRHGQLPAPIGKAVARLVGTHEHDTLNLSIVAPETEDNLEEAYIPTLRALAGAGPDGVEAVAGHSARTHLHCLPRE